MTALFGPQTTNAVTDKPPGTGLQRYGQVQTWFKNSSGPGASDGTVPDAAFYNRIVGALDYLVGVAGITALPGDDSALYRAILQVLRGDAPEALNTLKELADALGSDPSFSGTLMSMLGNRLRFDAPQTLSAGQRTQVAANLALDYANLVGKPTLGTAAALDVGTTASRVVQLDGSARLPAVDGSQLTGLTATGTPNRNRLINGGFSVFQRGGSSFASGAYSLDGAYVLAESGNVTVAQLTDPEAGAMFGIQLTQPDASAKRIGVCLPVEGLDIKDLRSAIASISGRGRISTSTNIRFALLETTATTDGFTKNVVNNWASTTYTPGNFFTAAVAVRASGVITPGANTWANFSANGTFGASMNNAILFVWSESQLAQNATLSLNRAKVEGGANVTAFAYDEPHRIVERCQRWYESFSAGVSLIASTTNVNRSVSFHFPWKVTKRAAGTAVLSGATGTRYVNLAVNATNAHAAVISFGNANSDGDDFGWGATLTIDVSIGV